MTNISENEPCLINTEQGFSVKYKDRLLYSKYSPQKNIISLVQNTQILPGSVILCISPILDYGLKELKEKLTSSCLVILVEAESELERFSKEHSSFEYFSFDKLIEFEKEEDKNFFVRVSSQELIKLPVKLENINHGQYKRCIRLDFSGASIFHKKFYDELYTACQNSISQFWKNRITLVRFGRRYSANIFKNLPLIPKSNPMLKVSKPILAVGAGESAVETLSFFNEHPEERINFFILAVDAVLQTFKVLKIRPDAVICEEAQDIIVQAFTGCKNYYDYLFVSATSNANVTHINPEKNIFYTTKYADTNYLKNLLSKNILQNPIPPLGSVGLSAVEIALKIRTNETIPIFVTGLDFSYSKGQTHAKMSFHEKKRRILNTKIKGLCVLEGSFGKNSILINGKNNQKVYTSHILLNYAKLFSFKYQNTKNIFDVGKTGLDLGLKYSEELFFSRKSNGENCIITVNTEQKQQMTEIAETVKAFFKEEKNSLLELKNIFTGKEKLPQKKQSERIEKLLLSREYLYLHFPDGYKLSLSQDFLNRVRIELDYFLKLMNAYSSVF